jgi:hypothetical protein
MRKPGAATGWLCGRALGQSAAGTIDVLDDCLRLEVTLPWLLAKLTERFVPAIRKEATLLLEKK